jgi:hypothetical protein
MLERTISQIALAIMQKAQVLRIKTDSGGPDPRYLLNLTKELEEIANELAMIARKRNLAIKTLLEQL